MLGAQIRRLGSGGEGKLHQVRGGVATRAEEEVRITETRGLGELRHLGPGHSNGSPEFTRPRVAEKALEEAPLEVCQWPVAASGVSASDFFARRKGGA